MRRQRNRLAQGQPAGIGRTRGRTQRPIALCPSRHQVVSWERGPRTLALSWSCFPHAHISTGPLASLPFPLWAAEAAGTNSAPARHGSLRSLCSRGEEAWALGSGSVLGARNLHGQMVSMKTLAAESSSCGVQRYPHGPDVGHPLPPALQYQIYKEPHSLSQQNTRL